MWFFSLNLQILLIGKDILKKYYHEKDSVNLLRGWQCIKIMIWNTKALLCDMLLQIAKMLGKSLKCWSLVSLNTFVKKTHSYWQKLTQVHFNQSLIEFDQCFIGSEAGQLTLPCHKTSSVCNAPGCRISCYLSIFFLNFKPL